MDLPGAISEGIVFLSYFSELPDKRQALKVRYPLEEVLLLCLVAMICDCNCVSEIARFGEKRLELLRRFSPYTYGTPCEDQLGVIVASLDVQAFQACFARWVAAVTGRPAEVIAIDGKTSRRSGTKGNKDALHTLSAFSARQKLVLGQVKVSEKSNEITAIPLLLDMLSIEGAVVTIDAMGCQKEVARKIIDKQADYILALKGNQGTLHEDVKLFAAEQIERRFADCRHDSDLTVDAEHGRIETRGVHVLSDIGWLAARHDWPGLTSIVMVDSLREIQGKSQSETRFYITSLSASAADISAYVRDHWAIENSLHWVLDMSFRDDESRVRTDNAPAIFAAMKHITANLLRLAPGKDSINLKRKTANWDDKYLEAVIRGN
jgi:predicted transposase YbfD/YdcC